MTSELWLWVVVVGGGGGDRTDATGVGLDASPLDVADGGCTILAAADAATLGLGLGFGLTGGDGVSRRKGLSATEAAAAAPFRSGHWTVGHGGHEQDGLIES